MAVSGVATSVSRCGRLTGLAGPGLVGSFVGEFVVVYTEDLMNDLVVVAGKPMTSPAVVIVRGLPSCGKTTWAREWVEERPDNRARVSRADIDAMAGGEWSLARASATRDAVLSTLLKQGVDVVVDDIHLSDTSMLAVMTVARAHRATILVYDMTNIALEEVLRRNANKPYPAPEDVIAGYHRTFVQGQKFPLSVPLLPEPEDPVVYVPRSGTPATYLVDVDGTMALRGDRDPFDWDRVGEDAPNEALVTLLEALDNVGEFQFVFVSGRPEMCREATEKWLKRHVGVRWEALYMRDAGDNRSDDVVKREIFDREIRERYNVVGVFDDRVRVVKMWRSMDLPVFQVAEGDF